MEQQQHPTTTVAILGANAVIDKALARVLEGKGYSIKLLEASSTETAQEQQLAGVDVVLLAPSLATDARDAFLDALRRSTSQRTTALTSSTPPIPVIALCSPTEEKEAPLKDEDEGEALTVRRVPWPTIHFERLMEEIEAALEVRLPPGYSLDRSDADVLILWDASGSVVSRFSPLGATRQAIEREAWEDYRKKGEESRPA